MFPRFLIPIALLCGCASPSPQFFGASGQAITVENRSFTVFRKDTQVQVVRHGYAGPAARDDIPAQMLRAVAQATGCTPIETSFQGDGGVRQGRIRC